MKKKYAENRAFKNLNTVASPITIFAVLIIVLATAVAVGMIISPFSDIYSDNFSSKAKMESALLKPVNRGESISEIRISGSTTVKPVSELLAVAFMETHPSCRIRVMGGGSSAGISSAGMGIVDIGSASRPLEETESLKFPDLQAHIVGGSAIVVILNGIEGNFIDKNELIKVFNDSDGKIGLSSESLTGKLIVDQAETEFQVFQRAEESGTEYVFAHYLGLGDNLDTFGSEKRRGNEGVLSAVESTPNSIGFVDFNFAEGSTNFSIAGIEKYSKEDINEDNIKAALAGNTVPYPSESATLTRPLIYLADGNPEPLEQEFLDFASSPEATVYFRECKYISLAEIN